MSDSHPLYFSASGEQQGLVADSAFRYGLLETMRAHRGSIPLWTLHLERLMRSACLDDSEHQAISAAVEQVAKRTRPWPYGARVRLRYGLLAGAASSAPHWDISAVPLSEISPWQHGVLLALCNTRLSAADTRSPFARTSGRDTGQTSQGCKLLRRTTYEQAAAEWSHWGEGHLPLLEPMLSSASGAVVEGVRSNLLVHVDGRWFSPRLDQCGVRGVMLRWLAGQVEIGEDCLMLNDLAQADELAVCNSVRGVVPARLLTDAQCRGGALGSANLIEPVLPGPATSALQTRISEKLW